MSVHSKPVMHVEGTQLLSAVPSATLDFAIPVISE
jgi:hypothetical protein